MKKLLLFILILITSSNLFLKAEEGAFSSPSISGSDSLSLNTLKDTTSNKEQDQGLKGKILRLDRWYNQSLNAVRNEFKGHLPIFEMGINSFAGTNYSGYSIPGFMDLEQGKSFEVNLRVFKFARGFQKLRNSIGFVSGLELNLNDYRFSGPYTLINEERHTNPSPLDQEGLSKTKLVTTYLAVPALIEFQLPAKFQDNRIYISGGIIGGLKLGSHTKVDQSGHKIKDHNDFNINPFRWGTTLRIGFKDINIFATYYKTALFKEGRGPEMYPFSIGIGLISK